MRSNLLRTKTLRLKALPVMNGTRTKVLRCDGHLDRNPESRHVLGLASMIPRLEKHPEAGRAAPNLRDNQRINCSNGVDAGLRRLGCIALKDFPRITSFQ
jgi:hypothetical protein